MAVDLRAQIEIEVFDPRGSAWQHKKQEEVIKEVIREVIGAQSYRSMLRRNPSPISSPSLRTFDHLEVNFQGALGRSAVLSSAIAV